MITLLVPNPQTLSTIVPNGESDELKISHTNFWEVDGNPICTASNGQFNPQIATYVGEAMIVWEDERNGNWDIYAQKINETGGIVWGPNGVAICTASDSQFNPQIMNSGSGAIITWQDKRNGTYYDIYAQKVDYYGVVQWPLNGVPICKANYDQIHPHIASGGDGIVITWEDKRGGTSDIYAQKISDGGTVQWKTNGVPVCNLSSSAQQNPQIIGGGFNTVIITWDDNRGANWDIYLQRLDSTGKGEMAVNGLAICTATGMQKYPQLCPDGQAGAYITWTDWRNGNADIFAQRFNMSDDLPWTTNGVAICTALGDQEKPDISLIISSYVIITWQDNRSGDYDIYAQRISPSGTVYWLTDGNTVCTASGNQEIPRCTYHQSGGGIFVWMDYRTADSHIYAQYLNTIGTKQWGTNGVLVCEGGSDQIFPQLCSDEDHGAFVTWVDWRNYNDDIYACRLMVPYKPTLYSFSPNPDNDGIMNVHWDDSEGATTYYIYRNLSAITTISGLTPIGSTHEVSYTDTILIDNTYYYVVVAGNPAGNSSISDCKSVQVLTTPETPYFYAITPNPDKNRNVALNWDQSARATQYYIYRSTSTINSISGLQPIAAPSGPIYIDTVPNEGTYYYVIVAGNNIANSTMSNCQSVEVIPSPIPAFPIFLAIIGLTFLIYLYLKKPLGTKKLLNINIK